MATETTDQKRVYKFTLTRERTMTEEADVTVGWLPGDTEEDARERLQDCLDNEGTPELDWEDSDDDVSDAEIEGEGELTTLDEGEEPDVPVVTEEPDVPVVTPDCCGVLMTAVRCPNCGTRAFTCQNCGESTPCVCEEDAGEPAPPQDVAALLSQYGEESGVSDPHAIDPADFLAWTLRRANL